LRSTVFDLFSKEMTTEKLHMRLPEHKQGIKSNQDEEYDPYDENMGTIRFHSAVCFTGFR